MLWFNTDHLMWQWFLRLQEMTASNQAMEDLKEQMGLKRLCATCDQVWINQDFFCYFKHTCISGMEKYRDTHSESREKLSLWSALVSGCGICISAGEAESGVCRGSPGGSASPPPHPAWEWTPVHHWCPLPQTAHCVIICGARTLRVRTRFSIL